MAETTETTKKRIPELVAFGSAVRQQRKAHGYSQEEFGDRCGIDRSYMGGIERGEHNLALVNILKIIKALEMQPSEFFQALDARPDGVRAAQAHNKQALQELANLLMEEAYQELMAKGQEVLSKSRR